MPQQHQTPMSGACYGCAHRRPIAGDAHSACYHPATLRAHRLEVAPVIEIIGDALPLEIPGLVVEFDAYGIHRGWCAWPYNFSPEWLISCDGYEPAEELS